MALKEVLEDEGIEKHCGGRESVERRMSEGWMRQ